MKVQLLPVFFLLRSSFKSRFFSISNTTDHHHSMEHSACAAPSLLRPQLWVDVSASEMIFEDALYNSCSTRRHCIAWLHYNSVRNSHLSVNSELWTLILPLLIQRQSLFALSFFPTIHVQTIVYHILYNPCLSLGNQSNRPTYANSSSVLPSFKVL